MKAIALWEPWASLIRIGAKAYETRSWPTNYRGPLLICAAKKKPDDLLEVFERHLSKKIECHPGFAVAVVDLVDCKRTDTMTLDEIGTDEPFGNFSSGRFAWKLENIRAIDPFPVKGKQGLFNVEFNYQDSVTHQTKPEVQMSKKQDKKQDDGLPRVFAFMTGPHTLRIISQNGAELETREVKSEEQAREEYDNGKLKADLAAKPIAPLGFSLVWIDDPAGNPEVIEACKIMENGGPAATETAKEQKKVEEVSINSIGSTFQIEIDGEFKEIAAKELKPGDTCRFFPTGGKPADERHVVVASPQLVDEDHGEGENWCVKLEKWIKPAAAQSGPKFAPSGKTKVIEVECAETYSEERIKKLVRGLQSLKAEAQADAADWRERIKAQEKALFEVCNGKSYTQMECTIEEDWDAGIRRYIRPDTGECAKEEQIPYEERQLNMGLDVPPAKPEDGAAAVADGTEQPAQAPAPEAEPVPDETTGAEPETTDTEETDEAA